MGNDPTRRFSNRVKDYVRWRPGYPAAALHVLEKEAGLVPGSIIADIGSGAGISTELFLKHGNTVYAVEPNPEMRQAAEASLMKRPNFYSVNGKAEATGLKDGSVDWVVAAQAFHWFDPVTTRREFARILKPGGQAVLMWNTRRCAATSFLRDYESLLQRHGTDYQEAGHRRVSEELLGDFFHSFQKRSVYNEQALDFEGLKGRLLSSSYTPVMGDPRFEPMIEELARIFQERHENGQVRFEYDTEIFFGMIQ
jgi:SAM-dependent methyltransferase